MSRRQQGQALPTDIWICRGQDECEDAGQETAPASRASSGGFLSAVRLAGRVCLACAGAAVLFCRFSGW
jgi:hypothetical protein